jgi:hypothetical protein
VGESGLSLETQALKHEKDALQTTFLSSCGLERLLELLCCTVMCLYPRGPLDGVPGFR